MFAPGRRTSAALLRQPDPVKLLFSAFSSLTLIVALGCLRPTAFGQDYSMAGFALCCVAGTTSLATQDRRSWRLTRDEILISFSTVVFFLYIALHSIAMGAAGSEWAIKAAIASIGAVTAGPMVLAAPKARSAIFLSLYFIVLALVASGIATMILSLAYPLRDLQIGEFEIEGYTNHPLYPYPIMGHVYLPFSVGYDIAYWGNRAVTRFGLGFREPGIAQAFVVWAIAFGTIIKRPRRELLALVVGLIPLGAITAVLSLTLTAVLLLIGRVNVSKVGVLLAGFAIAVAPLLALPLMELLELRQESHGESAIERTAAIARVAEQFFSNPLGDGLYSGKAGATTINLVAAIPEIGILGLIGWLFCTILVASIAWKRLEWHGLALLAPFIITSLLFQPLLDAPLVMFMQFSVVAAHQIAIESRVSNSLSATS